MAKILFILYGLFLGYFNLKKIARACIGQSKKLDLVEGLVESLNNVKSEQYSALVKLALTISFSIDFIYMLFLFKIIGVNMPSIIFTLLGILAHIIKLVGFSRFSMIDATAFQLGLYTVDIDYSKPLVSLSVAELFMIVYITFLAMT